MDPALLTLLLFGSLVALLLLGLPIVFTLGGLAILFTIWLWGPSGLLMIASHAYGESMSFILQFSDSNHMFNSFCISFNDTERHRYRGFHSDTMRYFHTIEPLLGINLMRTDNLPDTVNQNFCSTG